MRKYFLNISILFLLFSIIFCSTSARYPYPHPPLLTKNAVLLPVSPICQHPTFPTGCEATATVIALRFMGEDISVEEFIEVHLSMDTSFYYKGNTLYGPNPYRVFVGDPRTKSSYGCFSPVIYSALVDYSDSTDRVCDTSGLSLEYLCHHYIDRGIPVILWASSDMSKIRNGNSWNFPTGEHFIWPSGEHCLVLIGYNESDYFFCDPKYTSHVAYPRSIVEARYKDMKRQSLVILPKR